MNQESRFSGLNSGTYGDVNQQNMSKHSHLR